MTTHLCIRSGDPPLLLHPRAASGAPRHPQQHCQQKQRQYLRRLAAWLAAEVCDEPLAADDARLGHFSDRLEACIQHQARHDTPARSPGDDGRLTIAVGSLRVELDLLREVALACALELRENKAARTFEQRFMPTVRAHAGRTGGATAVDQVENFAALLILPRKDRQPRIATYQGQSRFGGWLRAVVRNYCITLARRRREATSDEFPEIADPTSPALEVDEVECIRALVPAVSRAIDNLAESARELLIELVVRGTPQVELAARLAINPGTLTRRRQRAEAAVLENMRQIAQASPQRSVLLAGLRRLQSAGSEEFLSAVAASLADHLRQQQ